jgi:hypothetical protein
LVAAGCVIDASDCHKRLTKGACERARADFGECMWLEVRAPIIENGECRSDAPSRGECIGYNADTNAGCFAIDCGAGEQETIYFEAADGGVKTFMSPHCGGGPVGGDWQECVAGPDTPPECACACAP